MKIFLLNFFLLLTFSMAAQESAKFTVYGNCGMCKTKIEKAANGLDGVSSAVWSSETHEIEVEYDASKVEVVDIKKAIAATGYDTDTERADKETYESLHGCCQYDRPAALGVVETAVVGQTVEFAVSGNCGGCKKRIEGAATSIDGVHSASWDADKQQLTVSYDDATTNLKAVKKAVAAVGHDVEGYNAKKKDYKALPGCCQYDRTLN